MAYPRRRLGLFGKAVVTLYLLAVFVLPFGHHDLACHLKSNTHCSTCTAGTSTGNQTIQPSLTDADLADAGTVEGRLPSRSSSTGAGASAGRSPPDLSPLFE